MLLRGQHFLGSPAKDEKINQHQAAGFERVSYEDSCIPVRWLRFGYDHQSRHHPGRRRHHRCVDVHGVGNERPGAASHASDRIQFGGLQRRRTRREQHQRRVVPAGSGVAFRSQRASRRQQCRAVCLELQRILHLLLFYRGGCHRLGRLRFTGGLVRHQRISRERGLASR